MLGTIGQREESLEEFLSVRGILDLVRQLACIAFNDFSLNCKSERCAECIPVYLQWEWSLPLQARLFVRFFFSSLKREREREEEKLRKEEEIATTRPALYIRE